MKKFTLIKMSAPGWERDFSDKFELQARLYSHICEQCRGEEGLTEISDVEHMLASACGCEFDVEKN